MCVLFLRDVSTHACKQLQVSGMRRYQCKKSSRRRHWLQQGSRPPHPPRPASFGRVSHSRNKHKPLRSVLGGNVKLKVALPQTRPHMCNGNVAPKHMSRPANPHQWKQTLTWSLAFCYVATLTGIIKKNKDIYTHERQLDSRRRKTSPQVFHTCAVSVSMSLTSNLP